MGKIEQAASQLGKPGEPVPDFIQRVITEEGTVHKAAVRLGVYPNTIKYWLKQNGYRLSSRHVPSVEKVGADG